MKISYDYEEILKEIKEDLQDGVLALEDNIQVLRDIHSEIDPQYIIDWYYSEDIVLRDTAIDDFDDLDDIREKEEYLFQYNEDKVYLELIKVLDFLSEIEHKNNIA